MEMEICRLKIALIAGSYISYHSILGIIKQAAITTSLHMQGD